MINDFIEKESRLLFENELAQDQLSDLVLFIWAIIGSIGYILTLIRAIDIGWTLRDLTYTSIIVAMLTAYFYRKKIATHHKVLLLIVVNFIVGITGLYTLGMLAGAAFFFPLAAVMVSIFYSPRIAVAAITLSILILFSIGLSFVFGFHQVNHDVSTLFTSFSHWSVYMICVIFYSIITCGIIIKYRLAMSQIISEKKQIEKALRKSEQFLNETGKVARVGGWELDTETMEVAWTEGTYQILEVSSEKNPSLDEAINFCHPSDRQKLETALHKALNAGEPYDMVIRFITGRGNTLWTRTICHSEKINGKVSRLFGIFQDVTENKKSEQDREKLIDDLQKTIEKVRTLSGLIPICASCKKIRDDKGYWNILEAYIEKHSDAAFSHGMCPDCSNKLYGNEDWYIEMKDDQKKEK